MISNDIPVEVERKFVAMKLGFVSMPATTAGMILQGFDINLSNEDILDIFASHGLSMRLRKIAEKRNFVEINRRTAGWSEALSNPDGEQASRIKGSAKKETKELKLFCVVKRNNKTGSLRCFGTSKQNLSAIELLYDYSVRWVIENSIKDLIQSYFLNQCPGTNLHAVDIHFLITTICRTLYRIVERDLGKDGKNPDGSSKTLRTMRDMLFRQGGAELSRSEDGFTISFLHPYRLKQTYILRDWFYKVCQRHTERLHILGGQKLMFKLLAPLR